MKRHLRRSASWLQASTPRQCGARGCPCMVQKDLSAVEGDVSGCRQRQAGAAAAAHGLGSLAPFASEASSGYCDQADVLDLERSPQFCNRLVCGWFALKQTPGSSHAGEDLAHCYLWQRRVLGRRPSLPCPLPPPPLPPPTRRPPTALPRLPAGAGARGTRRLVRALCCAACRIWRADLPHGFAGGCWCCCCEAVGQNAPARPRLSGLCVGCACRNAGHSAKGTGCCAHRMPVHRPAGGRRRSGGHLDCQAGAAARHPAGQRCIQAGGCAGGNLARTGGTGKGTAMLREPCSTAPGAPANTASMSFHCSDCHRVPALTSAPASLRISWKPCRVCGQHHGSTWSTCSLPTMATARTRRCRRRR